MDKNEREEVRLLIQKSKELQKDLPIEEMSIYADADELLAKVYFAQRIQILAEAACTSYEKYEADLNDALSRIEANYE